MIAVQEQLNTVSKELLHTVEGFTQENVNTIPFEGSWTAAQVCDHIMKYGAWILGTVTGSTRPADRDPEAGIQGVADIFLNFNLKFQSPDFILPTNEPLQLDHIIIVLKTLTDKLQNAAKEYDPAALCTNAELPTVGLLTRVEWINFFVVHTKRHIHQLKNIHAKLNAA